jgi:hypothetical protein
LSEQQWSAGTGLVTLSSAVLVLWLLHALFLPALTSMAPAGDGAL